MQVFAPTPFRYPPQTGRDYPWGYQDIPDDSLAQTLIAAGLVRSTQPGAGGGAAFDPNGVQTLTNKTISGANNTLSVRLANDVTGTLPLNKVGITGTPDGTKVLHDDGSWGAVSGTPFTQTLLNAVVAAGAGSSFSYPGGSSTLTLTGTNFNGAIVTFQYDAGGGNWQPCGDLSSFSVAGACTFNGVAQGTLVRCLVTGTPGAAITAVLAR
jgi:hypothetical protein